MTAGRLEQFLSERSAELNRGQFPEIVELDEENYQSDFTSKPSNDLVS